MLNCLNILQPSSDPEHTCAVCYMPYMTIHVYIINVFSTYVFPNIFQIQLWLRHLFLLLRSFSDTKLLENDENKPLSLLLPGRWAGPALYWALGDAHVMATNPRGPKSAEQQPWNFFSILELSLGQGAPTPWKEKYSVHPLKCQFGTPHPTSPGM